MSTTLNQNNVFANYDDDVWFDAPEELFEDALESHDDDMVRWNELHAYVPNPEKNHYPELPTIVLQQKISAFYYREPAPFEEHDPNLQNLFRIEEALGTLQKNHSKAMKKEDRKFNSILSRFDEAIDQACGPENTRTDADLKEVRVWYTRRLNEVTRTQELLEREYMVEFKELEMQVIAIENEWHAHQKSLAEHREIIADRLVTEDRARWGLRRQKRLEHLNYGMQDVANEQYLKIQELEYEVEQLQQDNHKYSFITHQIILHGGGKMFAEANNIYAHHQKIYQRNKVLDFDANNRENEYFMMPNGQQQWADYNSYYNEVEYEGEEGRWYALYSRDHNKRAFAEMKYHLDMKKIILDEAEQRANPMWENHDSVQNWMAQIPNFFEGINVSSSGANDMFNESHPKKRAFSDYSEDEEINGQQGRKRLRPISVIPRTPTPPCMLGQTCQENSNDSQKSWEEPGYFGHDGLYYGHDGQYYGYGIHDNLRYIPDPSALSGNIRQRPIYIDSNNGGPPLRRSTPPPHRRRHKVTSRNKSRNPKSSVRRRYGTTPEHYYWN
ncbi:hypothetical protein OCU04_006608 [Sclerotinia nivalis]|uniref:Uncharacterized protein n=1 Tax=Sclerotinia nivalis TaxID=352851 RepID=A0A9X0DJT6_9HELO|nr:hypothetical protein OCU04_006608 [Sclerotinia nivalis]